jgi:stearoyl-CoA desaturase (Delta-9 desaturase)
MLGKTIDHPIIRAMQRKHFVLLDIVPMAATVCACAVLARLGIQGSDWIAFGVFYVLGVIGIELGYHRCFSHGAFEAAGPMRAALLILGSMGGQGPVVTWASTHRFHHGHSDGPLDVHSPHAFRGQTKPSWRSIVHAQLMWKWTYGYPNPSLYTPNLLRDPLVVRLSKLYYLWVVLGILVPGLVSFMLSAQPDRLITGALFGGVIRLLVTQQMTFLINSLCHLAGAQPFRSRDESRNVGWLALLTLGGSLHNAHHAFPTTANNALTRGDIDPGYWILRALAKLGWVSQLKEIPDQVVARRRRDADGVLEVEEIA